MKKVVGLVGLGSTLVLAGLVGGLSLRSVATDDVVEVVQEQNVAVDPTALDAQYQQNLQALLSSLMNYVKIVEVRAVAEPALFAVVTESEEILYLDAERQLMFAGSMFELVDGNLVNRSAELSRQLEATFNQQRLLKMQALDQSTAITFEAKGEVKDFIWVFTDVDCPYCQKLHREVPALNNMGIEVRYLAYPRAGVNSKTGLNMQSAWCSADPLTAMTKLKALESITAIGCENPVAEHYALGGQVGVTGTPAIITSKGALIPGYMPADALVKRLQES